jgi:Fe-Mn family superoxide dismutase
MTIDRLPLPYAYEALAPHIGGATLHEHYDAHHASYVKKAQSLAEEAGLEKVSLQDIILKSATTPHLKPLFNNAAQAWNHDFYWHSMRPPGNEEFPAALAEVLARRFGSLDAFIASFAEKAAAVFGSGWAWLVWTRGGVDIVTTANGDTPATSGAAPLLTIDVWEHAYYLDRKHDRKAYIDGFMSSLANWNLAQSLLDVYRGSHTAKASKLSDKDEAIHRRLIWPHLTKMPA